MFTPIHQHRSELLFKHNVKFRESLRHSNPVQLTKQIDEIKYQGLYIANIISQLYNPFKVMLLKKKMSDDIFGVQARKQRQRNIELLTRRHSHNV
jgi:hypothetical protein